MNSNYGMYTARNNGFNKPGLGGLGGLGGRGEGGGGVIREKLGGVCRSLPKILTLL